MHKKITRLAFAGKWGFLGAKGLVAAFDEIWAALLVLSPAKAR